MHRREGLSVRFASMAVFVLKGNKICVGVGGAFMFVQGSMFSFHNDWSTVEELVWPLHRAA